MLELSESIIDLFIGIANFEISSHTVAVYGAGAQHLAQIWNSHGELIGLVCVTLLTALSCFPEPPEKRYYWFHSMLHVMLQSFGGSCLGPLMIGQLPGLVVSDKLVIIGLVCWYVTHFTQAPEVLELVPIQCLYNTLGMLCRAEGICSMTKLASSVISPARPIYGIPLVCIALYSIMPV